VGITVQLLRQIINTKHRKHTKYRKTNKYTNKILQVNHGQTAVQHRHYTTLTLVCTILARFLNACISMKMKKKRSMTNWSNSANPPSTVNHQSNCLGTFNLQSVRIVPYCYSLPYNSKLLHCKAPFVEQWRWRLAQCSVWELSTATVLQLLHTKKQNVSSIASGQSNLTKAALNPPRREEWGPHLIQCLCLHPKHNVDPLSYFCTAHPRDRLTDRRWNHRSQQSASQAFDAA